MKQLALIGILALMPPRVPAQNISEYFGAAGGSAYVYETDYRPEGGTLVREEVSVRRYDPAGTALIYRTFSPGGTDASYDVYALFPDYVLRAASVNAQGQRETYPGGPPVALAFPGNEWAEESGGGGIRYRYTTAWKTVFFGGAASRACICLQKETYAGDELRVTEYFYYVRGIGLARSYRINPEGEKSAPRVLVSCSARGTLFLGRASLAGMRIEE
jgi:hypothetical protein